MAKVKDDFLSMIQKEVDPEFTNEPITTTGFIDTGSYIFNALISGSIFGGFPNNRISILAGDPACGKSFFAMSCTKQFLIDNPTGRVVYFDTEFALDKAFFSSRGIDQDRVYIFQPATLEEFKNKCFKLLVQYEKMAERIPLLIVLDSYSNMSSEKEMADTDAGKDVRDMTKAQTGKAIFRVLTQKLGKLNVPFLLTSHVYAGIGQGNANYTPKVVAGGSGPIYASSTVVMLSKAQDKDAKLNQVVGSILHVKTEKSRFTKEKQVVDTNLNMQTGINRYYGLIPLALKYGIFKKMSKKIELPDGRTAFESAINKHPTKYYTDDILQQLDLAAQKEFKLGNGVDLEDDVEVEDVEE